MAQVPEIDSLIERGLTLYGQGDLDGALLQWEQALALDPENAQANSYVDYVRANYELLTSDGEGTQESAPFAIADGEPEYQIEIQPGEIKPSEPTDLPSALDPIDEGWAIDEATRDTGSYGGPPGIAAGPPPLTFAEPAAKPNEVSFDDATREYQSKMRPPAERSAESEFGPDGTPAFGHPNDFQTPPGFGTQTTGIKPRELGFVQPVIPTGTSTVTGLGMPPRPAAPTSSPRTALPEDAPTTQGPVASSLDEIDLISSLPSPRPAPSVPKVEIEMSSTTTRDFPHQTRAPAAPAFSNAPTKDMHVTPSFGAAPTQDFETKTTERPLDQTTEIPAAPAIVSAPTRDLGLRDAAVPDRPQTAPATPRTLAADGTRADVVLPFDPIDARSAEILDDADEGAPQNETREDKTRRRITTLFEKAAQWSGEGDLERAVAAVDLALSEDPNSALAQKLIHRNRETIMGVFQTYLGPLDRTPQLARPLHELASAPISPRAAFLLSRIDGLITVDEILDVCGMPRLEAYRYLCQLFLRNILR